MSISVAALQLHLAYTAWATRGLVESAGRLSHEELTRDFGTADKSVLGTLVHILGADRIWLARLLGEPQPPYATDGDYSLASLENKWPAIHEGWRQWAAGLTDGDTSRVVSYSDLRGNPWRQPLWQLVLHVVNHGTHHRGQVSGFLRAMGHVPPKLDLIQYYRLEPD